MDSSTLAATLQNNINHYGNDVILEVCDTFYSSVFASPAQTVKSLMVESDCSFMELVCDIDPNFTMNLKLDTLVCCIINSDGEDEGGMALASEAEEIVKSINENNSQGFCDWE